ncbi:MAG: hypothetical protein IJS45_04675 [Clostridia bacterium]|nr:hypothetical protein [Clostridia bacterium]
MKKYISFVLALVFAALVLSSCGAKDLNFVYADGKISSGDATYICAPMGFQPCQVGEKCATRDGAFELYEIKDRDGNAVPTDEWMTEEYAGDLTSIYYREGKVNLPEYSEIDFDTVYVCEEDETVVYVTEITDKELISTLIDALHTGATSVMLDEPTETYSLKFHSKNYPAIYYSVKYLIYEDGAYLFSRGTKTYANIGTLLDGYADQLK